MILREYKLITRVNEKIYIFTSVWIMRVKKNLDWIKVYVIHYKNGILMNVSVNINN